MSPLWTILFVLHLCLFRAESSTSYNSDLIYKYEPNWDSLDKRPIPDWYDKAKIGIFLHWGVFSVPSFGSEWFWSRWDNGSKAYVTFMENNYPKSFTYQDFARDFTAHLFNASAWAELFKQSGAKYVVLTSKHHEGYTLWPSKYSYSWNAMDVGPHRDLVGELSDAVRKENLHFGLYHSLFEWFNPMYLSDLNNSYTTQEFVDKKCLPEMKELITKYKPDIVWSDGYSNAPYTYWKSTEFLAWLYNESPVKDVVVANDRWGHGIGCHHGDFLTCHDRYNPGVLQTHKWENAMTLDKHSWGYRREARLSDYLTIEKVIEQVVSTISCGGNILINVGPTKDGTISPIFEERLLQLGEWLSINGEAIYESKPWKYQNDTHASDVWYTSKDDAVYAFVLKWPSNNTLTLESVKDLLNPKTTVQLLGRNQNLKWDDKSNLVNIYFPDKAAVKGRWSWVLKIK